MQINKLVFNDQRLNLTHKARSAKVGLKEVNIRCPQTRQYIAHGVLIVIVKLTHHTIDRITYPVVGLIHRHDATNPPTRRSHLINRRIVKRTGGIVARLIQIESQTVARCHAIATASDIEILAIAVDQHHLT